MRGSSQADEIWNRATDPDVITDSACGPGDRAWAAVLLFDGMAQNGGPLSVFELEAEEVATAKSGCAWLGRDAVVGFIEHVAAASVEVTDESLEELEVSSTDQYLDLTGDGAAIEAAFHPRLDEQPGDFRRAVTGRGVVIAAPPVTPQGRGCRPPFAPCCAWCRRGRGGCRP